jgi:hypothetical protein
MKKRGRPPSIWHTEAGMAFLYAVFTVQEERHPIKIVDAIISVLNKPEFTHLKQQYGHRLRYLEKKYQEISNANPYSRLHQKIRRAAYLRAIYEKRRAEFIRTMYEE